MGMAERSNPVYAPFQLPPRAGGSGPRSAVGPPGPGPGRGGLGASAFFGAAVTYE